MNECLTLESPDLLLELLPDVGGSIRNLFFRRDGKRYPIMRESKPDVARSSDTASFLMMPYPNRIRDAKFKFNGAEYEIAYPEKHAIHGYVRDRAWQKLQVGKDYCRLVFDSSLYPEIDYPFPFYAETFHKLENGGLYVEFTLKNSGRTPMPAGFGMHPYFTRSFLGKEDEAIVQFKTAGVYPSKPEIPLPTGTPQPLPKDFDFSSARALGSAEFDHCFSDWDGRAQVLWPKSQISLLITSSTEFGHLVLYTPKGKSFFALEPQTQMIDGVNFLANGFDRSGVHVLEPGASMRANVFFSVCDNSPR